MEEMTREGYINVKDFIRTIGLVAVESVKSFLRNQDL